MLRGLLLAAGWAAVALFAGCGGHEDDHAGHDHGEHEDEHGHEHAGEHEDAPEVHLPPERWQEFGVEVAAAGPGELDHRLALSGEVHLNEDRVAHIVPPTPGIVREVRKSVGDLVQAGEVLAILESAELGEAKLAWLTAKQRLALAELDLARLSTIHDNTQALLALLEEEPALEELRAFTARELGENRSRLVGAYSEHVFARATLERERQLFERRIGSESDYLAAESQAKRAEAEYAAARDSIRFELSRDLLAARREKDLAEFEMRSADRRLHVLGVSEEEIAALAGADQEPDLAHHSLRAPFTGTVVERHITLGEMLEPTESAFTIADLSRVWVDLTVYQKDLDRVRRGQPATIKGDGREAHAAVVFVSPILSESTRTAIARVHLENEDGAWRPGMFVGAALETERATAPILVPKSALQTLDGGQVVFVATEDGFAPRPVQVGRNDETSVEIVEGLAEGERYAAAGAFLLKAELEKGDFGHGHAH